MIKFKKQELEEMDLPYEGTIEDRIIDTSRWSEIHEIIFEKDGKFYSAEYSCGATEGGDETPWEYNDEIECTEVEKKIVQVENGQLRNDRQTTNRN